MYGSVSMYYASQASVDAVLVVSSVGVSVAEEVRSMGALIKDHHVTVGSSVAWLDSDNM